MIKFDFNKYCYGCVGCANVCPTDAISMQENKEGFMMPHIDMEKCIQCGACERVCIYPGKQKKHEQEKEMQCYALYGSRETETVMKSASAGVFPALAEKVLKDGGYVCGCVWNEKMEAVHIISNDRKEVERMLHSKYTQSNMQNVYRETQRLLQAGEKVLFSGTPCQIAAVLRFTGNPENLYTCDVICKGVPSPGVWRKYKDYLEKTQGSRLKSVILRGKHRYGWNGPVTKYDFEDGSIREDLFFQLNHYIVGFLDGLYMRNSCYSCEYKDKNHEADIVLGDFWGINRKDFFQSGNKGVSAVIVRTDKGRELFEAVRREFVVIPVSYEEMVEKNPSMTGSTPLNPKRERFFKEYETCPVEENISRNTDLLGNRKKLLRFLYKTGLFTIFKRCKTKFYKG